MIGIDILEIVRVQQLISDKFLDRVFTDNEKAYILSKKTSANTVTGMFCAKEAVLKALNCGIGNGSALKQVEIVHKECGCPYVKLYGNCQQLLADKGYSKVELSISHNDTTAVAVAVLIK